VGGLRNYVAVVDFHPENNYRLWIECYPPLHICKSKYAPCNSVYGLIIAGGCNRFFLPHSRIAVTSDIPSNALFLSVIPHLGTHKSKLFLCDKFWDYCSQNFFCVTVRSFLR
jgi:hypothetical protein